MRGWRSTVGNLIEILRLKQNLSRASFDLYKHDQEEGYGFIEFGISNITISTVLRQSLIPSSQPSPEVRCLTAESMT